MAIDDSLECSACRFAATDALSAVSMMVMAAGVEDSFV